MPRCGTARDGQPQGSARARVSARRAGERLRSIALDRHCTGRRSPTAAARRRSKSCRRARRALRVALAAARRSIPASACASRATARMRRCSVRCPPMPSRAIRSASAIFWSPVLEGDIATIEIPCRRRRSVPDVPLDDRRESRTRSLRRRRSTSSMRRRCSDIGTSGACKIDVACVTPQSRAFVDSTKAVAAIEFTQEDGFTYLCTGQLLNDSRVEQHAVLLLREPLPRFARWRRARSNTFWFFDAVELRKQDATPPFVQQCGRRRRCSRGASTGTGRSCGSMRAPPAGAKFSAWRAEPIPYARDDLRHPSSAGRSQEVEPGDGAGLPASTPTARASRRCSTRQGTTEPGSSGAGLLTFCSRRVTTKCAADCGAATRRAMNPRGTDEYSRLDNMLPLTRQYLTPERGRARPGKARRRRVLQRALDHYFMTISPRGDQRSRHRRASGLGAHRPALPRVPDAGAGRRIPVCRFYRTPGFGDSHFYSASPSECQAVIAQPEDVSRLDVRKRQRVLHRAAGCGDGRVR